MNIIGTQYTLTTNSFEIYVAGCNGSPHCKGCHNPETWSFNQGKKCDDHFIQTMMDTICKYDCLIQNIMVFGGEPLDQNIDELCHMLAKFKNLTDKKIWIFTRYDIQDIPISVLNLCDYVKCGTYDEDKKTDNNIQYGISLATSNQCIYKKGVNY